MDAEKENHPPSKLNNRWTASQKGEGRVTVKSISEREFFLYSAALEYKNEPL